MCGIFAVSNHPEAPRLTYLGLYALQHRGEESAGIISFDGKKTNYQKKMGQVGDAFGEESLASLKGKYALGHVRYSTTGSSSLMNIQPFFVRHKKGHISIAHNGNLTNTFDLHNKMEDEGSIFQTSTDSEIITHLIAKSSAKDIKIKIKSALSQLEGAYSLAIMADGMIIGARDPSGFRPLCLGKLNNSYILTSETCALDLIHAKYIRDIEPGEILFIKDKKLESVKLGKKEKSSFCIFEHVYFARPDSNIFTKNVYLTRKRLGQQLAKEYQPDCDFAMPIPDSGSYAALGYAEAAKLSYETGMIRNHYVGRTFIQPSQFIRDFRVRVKLNPVKDVLAGKKVLIIEDSIVRGTTSKARIKTLREAGAKEVHMGVSCPPIKFPCFYGIDFPTKEELIASKKEVDEIRDFMGLDSLHYLSLKGMLKAMYLPSGKFCTACFNGKYPVDIPESFNKNMLEEVRKCQK
ncbi:MAG: amidophosphoribosyltransferase [Candidatus Omnitrophica bacterium]|nr:amidophosphoribosyltransferase [Candidatus Omnitrophota bacterium]MCF7877086.1 amidophosphoribosyltransferase [Candidatus Omnitrophota bacterium]MCF7878294.1 amidophosphoribosyltransferase [Candidatus Omnitrophota bacterium]